VVDLDHTDNVVFAAVGPLGSVAQMATVECCSAVDIAFAAVASFAAEEQMTTVELVVVHRMNLLAVDPLFVGLHMRIAEQGFVDGLSVAAVVPFAVK